MTDHLDRLNPEEREAQRAVRNLPVRGAHPAFRRSLGDLFVSGSLQGSLPGSGTIDPERVADPPVEGWDEESAASPNLRPESGSRLTTRPRLRPVGLTLVAAAAVWALVSLRWGADAPDWALVASEGQGTVWVDEVAYDARQLPRAELRSGAHLRTDSGIGLELVRAEVFAIELSPGSDLTLPRVEEDGSYSASVRSGMATWVTGSSFPGHELRIETPDAEVQVHGTTFAVLADDEKTCVSVFEGVVGLRTIDGQVHPVEAGRCRRVYRAPEPKETEDELSAGQVASLTHWYARSHELLPDSAGR